MNIAHLARGRVELDDPAVSLTWGISTADALAAFVEAGAGAPREVTPAYFATHCRVLGDVSCQLGLHFDQRGRLERLELFGNGASSIEASYRTFDKALRRELGRPRREQPGGLGELMPDTEWCVGPVQIEHYVMDRFGPEEHLNIRRRASGLSLSPAGLVAVLVSVVVLVIYWFCVDPAR